VRDPSLSPNIDRFRVCALPVTLDTDSFSVAELAPATLGDPQLTAQIRGRGQPYGR